MGESEVIVWREHRDKRHGWGEGRPGGQAFSVITPVFQWDGERDKMRPRMLSDEVKKKKSKV